MLENCANNNK